MLLQRGASGTGPARTHAGARKPPHAPAPWPSARSELRTCARGTSAAGRPTRNSTPLQPWQRLQRDAVATITSKSPRDVVAARAGSGAGRSAVRMPRKDVAQAVDKLARIDARRVLAQRARVLRPAPARACTAHSRTEARWVGARTKSRIRENSIGACTQPRAPLRSPHRTTPTIQDDATRATQRTTRQRAGGSTHTRRARPGPTCITSSAICVASDI